MISEFWWPWLFWSRPRTSWFRCCNFISHFTFLNAFVLFTSASKTLQNIANNPSRHQNNGPKRHRSRLFRMCQLSCRLAKLGSSWFEVNWEFPKGKVFKLSGEFRILTVFSIDYPGWRRKLEVQIIRGAGGTHDNFFSSFECFGTWTMLPTILRKLHHRKHQHSRDVRDYMCFNILEGWVVAWNKWISVFFFHNQLGHLFITDRSATNKNNYYEGFDRTTPFVLTKMLNLVL